jgi:hypothetical protein
MLTEGRVAVLGDIRVATVEKYELVRAAGPAAKPPKSVRTSQAPITAPTVSDHVREAGKHGTSCSSVEGPITDDTIRREAGADNRPQGDRRATKVGVVVDFGRLFNRGHAA